MPVAQSASLMHSAGTQERYSWVSHICSGRGIAGRVHFSSSAQPGMSGVGAPAQPLTAVTWQLNPLAHSELSLHCCARAPPTQVLSPATLSTITATDARNIAPVPPDEA